MRPVIPATLAPQIRHFREISAIKDEWRLFNQIRKVYLCRGAKKAKGVSGLIVESVQGVAIGLFKIVDHGRNDRGGTGEKISVGNNLERNNRLSQSTDGTQYSITPLSSDGEFKGDIKAVLMEKRQEP